MANDLENQLGRMSGRLWKSTTVSAYLIGGIFLSLLIMLGASFFFTFTEKRNSSSIKDTVYKAIEGGYSQIKVSEVFTPHNGFSAEGYDTICFLTGASAPVDYSVHVDKLLSSGQLTALQFSNLPDLFDFYDYSALFLLVKKEKVIVIPLNKNSLLAKGRLPKGDFFSFRFDTASRPNTSSHYGCLDFEDSVFQFYADDSKPYRILLSKHVKSN